MSGALLTWSLAIDARKRSVQCKSAPSLAEPAAAFSHCDKAAGITAAGVWRGDNLDGLRSELQAGDDAGLGSIIIRGWQKWGRQLAQHVRGPFAIAVYDEACDTLYLARDPLGLEPLFLARTPTHLAASGCPRGARRAAQLASAPDTAMIADFALGTITSTKATFHKGLSRVPPGHWTKITSDGEICEAYWSLDPHFEAEPQDDPAARFRGLLASEVKRSGGHDDALAVLLSGGLDSSSVAALVADTRPAAQDAATLSLTYESNPKWVDGPHIAAMRAVLDMDHRSLPSGKHDPFSDIDDVLNALDGPCFGYGVSVSTSLFSYAKEHGFRTVLHGHGGDEIVSYGNGRLNELAAAGRWRTLWQETPGTAALWSQPRWRVFERFLVHRPEWRRVKELWKKLKKPARAQQTAPILTPTLMPSHTQSDADERPISSRHDHTERDLQIAALIAPIQPHALETIKLTGRFHGLKIGLPFMSRDLAEFSVSLPSHWKLRGGKTRYILREAIRPLVPASITNRADKNDFTRDFVGGLLASRFAREYADPDNPALTRYINAQWLKENWAKVDRDGANVSIDAARGLWRAAVLGRWLAMDRDAGIIPATKGHT